MLAIAGIFGAMLLQIKPDSATVSRESGYYIFTDSKPSSEYDFISEIKANAVQMATGGNGEGLSYAELSYDQFKRNIIKQADKKHKGKGNGLIFHPERNTADLIMIK